MVPKRKSATSATKSSSAKTSAKRSYKAPAIRKDQKLARVTGLAQVTGQQT